jgi:glycosyltransferase involved in cell wall biosynthesis
MRDPWILVLCHEFPPLGGGAGKNLYLLCRELTRRGVRVRVWTGDPGAAKRWQHGFPVDYIRVGRKNRFETSRLGMIAFVAGAVLRAWFRASGEASPPALVFSNLGIPAGLAGTLVSRRYKAPHAVWYQGSDVHAGRPGGAAPWQRRLVRWVTGSASRNFFVSPGLRDMARGFGPVPNPSLLPTCPSQEILAAPLGAAAAVPAPEQAAMPRGGAVSSRDAGRYFLFLGRFDPVKNPVLVVLAADRLKGKDRLTRIIRMVGGGALGGEVARLIRVRSLAQQVVIEGAASFEKVPELLRSAYALVVPSRIEGFNTTILEAAHFGVPSIGSDTVGIRDFIRHGETGLLFPENDDAALARAMGSLDADPALRDELGRKASEAARPYHPGSQADAFMAEAEKAAPGLRAAPTLEAA